MEPHSRGSELINKLGKNSQARMRIAPRGRDNHKNGASSLERAAISAERINKHLEMNSDIAYGNRARALSQRCRASPFDWVSLRRIVD